MIPQEKNPPKVEAKDGKSEGGMRRIGVVIVWGCVMTAASAAQAHMPAQAAGTASSVATGQADTAARLLLSTVRQVVRENPALADSQGDRALLEAVARIARQQPHHTQAVVHVATRLKPQLAERLAQIASPTPVMAAAPVVTSPPSTGFIPASNLNARTILLENVRAAIHENPALRDSVGDRALVEAVRRSVAQHPTLKEDVVMLASRLKPHLAAELQAVGSAKPTWAASAAALAPSSAHAGEDVPDWAITAPVGGMNTAADEADIFAMGLEDLMNAKVVTASKSQERAFDVPAAITVITNEDIRRSGQTNIMEVLRMVPGMQVSRINSSSWAISARGFADEYANKMLVMVDGRSVYTPTFSGVYWDLLNMPLEDVDRVEVIRGPGATVWGANAVNGVINVVTKDSRYTQGAYVSGGLGDQERAFAEGRVGGKIGEHGHYRMYSRYLDRAATENMAGAEQNNAWWRMLTGVRADWSNGGNDRFTVQGELQKGQNEQESIQLGASPVDAETTMSYLRGRWERALEQGGTLTVSGYLDQHHRETDVLEQRVTTMDVDVNHSFRWQGRNNLVWGAGYRLSDDSYNTTPILNFVPSDDQQHLFSTFVQNTFEATDRLDLTLGTKLEHNSYTGFEIQPTGKFAFSIDNRSTLWGSVARAVRSPSRTEDSIEYNFGSPAPGMMILGIGNGDVESEELIAYELGYRISPREGLIVDIATYYNDYDNLTTLTQGMPYPGGPGFIIPLNVHNLGSAEMYGIELSTSWQVNPQWLLSGYYSYGHLNASAGAADQLFLDYESLWPEHSFSIRSLYNITEDVEFDMSLYYVSSLNNAREVSGVITPIDDYLKWDVRLGWRPMEGLELSLVGLDLLESGHQQFINSRFFPASQIGRSYYGKVSWHF